jgi:hypothetical protein
MTQTTSTTTVGRNDTEFNDYIVKHRDDYQNATAVRECSGAISFRDNGVCIKCGFPTTKIAK